MLRDEFKAGGLFLMLYMFLSFVTGHPITIIGGISWFMIGTILLYFVGLFTIENLNRKKDRKTIFSKIRIILLKIVSVLIVYPLCYLLFDISKAFRDSTKKFFKDLRRL